MMIECGRENRSPASDFIRMTPRPTCTSADTALPSSIEARLPRTAKSAYDGDHVGDVGLVSMVGNPANCEIRSPGSRHHTAPLMSSYESVFRLS